MDARSRNLLIGLFVLAGVSLIVATLVGPEPQRPSAISEDHVSDELVVDAENSEPALPPLTDDIRAKLQQSSGFQHLISYTENGFEPNELIIKKGETVRFTNNSREDLWVVAAGDVLYPETRDGCGVSALDSCLPELSYSDFWEFTFEVAGTWQYVNNLHKIVRGTIEVR